MAGPKNQSLKIDDFDDDLFDESDMPTDIDSDFDMLSEEELNSLFDESNLDESDETQPVNKNNGDLAKNSPDSPLPDHLKDFDFGDDDFDDY